MAEEHFYDGSVTKDPEELVKMIERDAETIASQLEGLLGNQEDKTMERARQAEGFQMGLE